MTPSEPNMSGSNKTTIESIIEFSDEVVESVEDDDDMRLKLLLLVFDTIELANMATHAIIEFNSLIWASFSIVCFLRCISRLFIRGHERNISMNCLAYERNSSDVFERANDMKPTQKITSLFSVPKQNVVLLLRPVMLLLMLPIWLESDGPDILLELNVFFDIMVSLKLDEEDVYDELVEVGAK